jgi:hypothetical protein
MQLEREEEIRMRNETEVTRVQEMVAELRTDLARTQDELVRSREEVARVHQWGRVERLVDAGRVTREVPVEGERIEVERPYRADDIVEVRMDRPGTPRMGTPVPPLPLPVTEARTPTPQVALRAADPDVLQEVVTQMADLHRTNTEMIRSDRESQERDREFREREAVLMTTNQRLREEMEEIPRQLNYSRAESTYTDRPGGPEVNPVERRREAPTGSVAGHDVTLTDTPAGRGATG